MSLRTLLSTASFLSLTCALAHAGVVTGHLVDSQGQPVQNAVFDVQNSSGNAAFVVSGGFTDANGNFTTTITPSGSYRITVFPQPPPASLVVTKRLDNVVIGNSTNNLGTITLQRGHALSGRVVNVVGTPLVGVGLEFVAAPDFQPLDFTNGDTTATGRFTVAVPFGPCTLQFKPGPVPYYGGPGTAPTTRSWNISGDMDVGDVVMPSGFTISGSVQQLSGNGPVEDARIEVVDTTSGAILYTPDNRTSTFGSYLLTVPAGTYDLRILPHSNDDLASATIQNVSVPPSTSLGTTFLADAVELRGKAFDANGSSVVGATIGLVDANTNQVVPVADNVTASGGNYRISVPTGTFHVTFSAPTTIPFGLGTVSNVVVTNNTHQDGTMPAVPFFTNVGTGVAGTGGVVPQIRASGGTPRLGNLGYTLECTSGLGGARAMIETWIGTPPPVFSSVAVAMQGRMLRLDGNQGVAGAGTARVSLPIPNSSSFAGLEIRARFSVQDPAAPKRRAMTNELRATIAP